MANSYKDIDSYVCKVLAIMKGNQVEITVDDYMKVYNKVF